MRRCLFWSLAAVGLVVALPTSATAAGPTIEVTPHSVRAGQIVRIHGIAPGCPAGDEVTLISEAFSHAHDFAGLPAVFARVGDHGAYSVRTRIPAGRRAGSYRITGRCGGGNLGVAASLRVLSAAGGVQACGDVVVHFSPEGSGGAHNIRAVNVGCATARTISRCCVAGRRTRGWRYHSVHGRYTITSGRRRVTYVAIGGGGCAG